MYAANHYTMATLEGDTRWEGLCGIRIEQQFTVLSTTLNPLPPGYPAPEWGEEVGKQLIAIHQPPWSEEIRNELFGYVHDWLDRTYDELPRAMQQDVPRSQFHSAMIDHGGIVWNENKAVVLERFAGRYRWIPLTLAIIGCVIAALRSAQRSWFEVAATRHQRQQCVNCQYDLRGSATDTCPECGTSQRTELSSAGQVEDTSR